MLSRRELLQVAAATAAIFPNGLTRALAQQRLTQAELLAFEPLGNVTLLHVTDVHGQLMPVHFREPSANIGVGEAKGQPPHIAGKDFLTRFGIPEKSAAAYALTSEDFAALAQSYGRIGGLDRLATAVKAARAQRGEDKVLLLDGGDTWQGSLGANRDPRPGHGRLLQAVEARRHDRPLGVHLRHRPGEGTGRQSRLRVPRAEHPRHRMAGAGVSLPTGCSRRAA